MTKLSLLLCGAVVPAAVLFACATDNGDAVHGPQFGPPPERADGAAVDGPVTSEEGGPTTDADASVAADGDVDSATPACTSGTVAVLAGDDSTLTGAVQINGAPWSGTTISGGAAKSAPSLVALGTGFAALTRGASDAIQAVSYGASWSAASAVSTLTTLGTPALAVLGTKGEAVLLSGAPASNRFFRLENGGASWGTTADPVMPPAGAQSFGPSAGALATAGTDLAFAQDGSDSGLYVQTWNGTSWTTGVAIFGAGTFTSVPPALATGAGTYDLVLLYADNTANHVIGYATRNAATKTWSNASVTQATAQTSEQMSVVRISPTTILVAFRGNNARPYFMTGTLGAAGVTWSTPLPLLADSSTVDAAPAVAKGVCGDDAIAVFASGGQVKASRYRGTTWGVPGSVTGASGVRVSVATR